VLLPLFAQMTREEQDQVLVACREVVTLMRRPERAG
jgi:hypothetical protein